VLAGGFAALRIFFGAVWLSNGLAKAIGQNTFDWGFFQWLLTIAELTAGAALLFGIASRFGALIGLLLIGPIWIMLLPRNQYLWDYPLDLFPLVVLTIVPAGRTFGLDRNLAVRFRGCWPS